MNNKKSEKGQALIVITLAIVVLVGFAALAIDGSRVFSDKRNAQNAADTATMAAALARTRGQNYTTAALDRATSNSYTNDADSIVVVTTADTPSGACPATGKDITVTVTSNVKATFAQVLGRSQFTNVVSATARACDVSGGTGAPAFPGQSVYTTKTGSCNSGTVPALYMNAGDLQVWGGDVGSASTDPTCIKFSGGQTQLKLEESGSACSDLLSAATSGVSKGNISGQDGCGNLKMGQSFPTAPADLGITCNGIATKSGSTLSPGNYYKANFGNLDFPGGATALDAGTYCVMDGNMNVTGSLNGSSGVTIFVKQGSVTFTNNSTPNLRGSTSGPYKGLTIYLPPSNSNDIAFSGKANMVFKGTILAQSSDCVFSNTGVQLQKVGVQFVCSTWGMLGGQAEITYNANEVYSPQTTVNPTIAMLK